MVTRRQVRIGGIARGVGALWRDRRGAAAITFAVVLPAMVGLVGLGTETGVWYATKRQLQTAADAAAVSGAWQRARGDAGGVTAAATREATRHGFVDAPPASLSIRNPPTAGAHVGVAGAVEAVLSQQQALFFSALFADQGVTVGARAVARVQTVGAACVLALDPTAGRALASTGSSIVDFSNCVMASNSGAPDAIYISGSTDLTAESLWTNGGIQSGGSGNVHLEDAPLSHMWPLPDPYAGVNVGSVPAGCGGGTNVRYQNTTQTINPGVYCGGIDFGSRANITLNPGVYYVNGGDVLVNAQATVRCNCNTVTGTGVTIVLTTTGATSTIGMVRINGGATVDLRAPTAAGAPFQGILFYQDRRATTTVVSKFNGGSNQKLSGALYFPQQQVEFTGDNTTAGVVRCMQLVARIVTFIGNATVRNTGCEAAGIVPIEITGVRIVE